MKWVRHVVLKGIRKCYKILVRKPLKGVEHAEDLGIIGRKILEWTLGK
jgi:hypothetical protein